MKLVDRFNFTVGAFRRAGYKVDVEMYNTYSKRRYNNINIRKANISGGYIQGEFYDTNPCKFWDFQPGKIRITTSNDYRLSAGYSSWRWRAPIDINLPKTDSEATYLIGYLDKNMRKRNADADLIYLNFYPRYINISDRIQVI
jgi:hypothetical protein